MSECEIRLAIGCGYPHYNNLLSLLTIYFSLSYTTQSKIAVPLNEKYLAPKKEAKKAHDWFFDKYLMEGIIFYMKVEKLVIGNTYYVPSGTWNYKKGVLIRILDDKKRVLLEHKSGKIFRCSINKLHTVPYKAVAGYKARERVKREMKEAEQKERENLVDKNVQKKVKKLGHSIYATNEKDKYIVIGYSGLPQPRFNKLEELEKWADDELIRLEARREEIRSKGYKYLKIEDKNGQASYYQNLNFIFTKFEIRCKNFKGNISEISEDKILNRNDVPEMKINIAR